MRPLDPPIGVIEDALFGAPESPLAPAPSPDAGVEAPPAAMPDYLRQAVGAALATERRYAGLAPDRGQVRTLLSIPEGRPLPRPLAVLLDRRLEGALWAGWLACPEADYAGDTDLVLDEGDGPFDPIASMVQAWNPVRVLVPGNSRVVAVLSPDKLAVVTMLSAQAGAPRQKEPARPGRISARDFSGGHVALTGTPLSDTGDPRADFRQLYLRIATELVEASERAARTNKNSGWLANWMRSPIVTGAFATLVLAQAGVIALLMQGTPNQPGPYRSIPREDAGPRVRVRFAPDVPVRDMHALLSGMRAQIEAGPDETGAYVVRLPASVPPTEALARLRAASKVIDAAEVLDGKGH